VRGDDVLHDDDVHDDVLHDDDVHDVGGDDDV